MKKTITKRKLAVITAIVTTISIFGLGLLLYQPSQATPAPLPTSLDMSGTGLPCRSGPIQTPSGNWTITLTYTPLNQSASITVLNTDDTINNYKVIPAGSAGSMTLQEDVSTPVYLMCYASSWHLTARPN